MNYLASNSAWGEGGFRSHLYGSGGRTEEKKASKFWKTAGKKPEGGVKKENKPRLKTSSRDLVQNS